MKHVLRLLRPLGAALFAVAMLAGVPAASRGGPLAAGAAPRTVSVDATATAWASSGVAVERGDRIVFRASGSADFCIFSGGCPSGPAGVRRAPGECEGGQSYDGLRNIPCWSLVGKWSGGTAFYIGSGKTLTAPRAGTILLGIHDEYFPDNEGAYSVTITGGRPTYEISGRVVRVICGPVACRRAPLEGASLTARTAGGTLRAVTDGAGKYTIEDVAAGDVTLTPRGPAGQRLRFAPESRAFTLEGDRPGVDFLACAAHPDERRVGTPGGGPCQTVTLAGHVLDIDREGFAGMCIALRQGDGVWQVTSAGGGLFAQDVPAGGTYSVDVCDRQTHSRRIPARGLSVRADRDRTGLDLVVLPVTLKTLYVKRPRLIAFTVIDLGLQSRRHLVVLRQDGGPVPCTRLADATATADGRQVSFALRPAAGEPPFCPGDYRGRVTRIGDGKVILDFILTDVGSQ